MAPIRAKQVTGGQKSNKPINKIIVKKNAASTRNLIIIYRSQHSTNSPKIKLVSPVPHQHQTAFQMTIKRRWCGQRQPECQL